MRVTVVVVAMTWVVQMQLFTIKAYVPKQHIIPYALHRLSRQQWFSQPNYFTTTGIATHNRISIQTEQHGESTLNDDLILNNHSEGYVDKEWIFQPSGTNGIDIDSVLPIHQLNTDETVHAILAASEEAAAAAESSLLMSTLSQTATISDETTESDFTDESEIDIITAPSVRKVVMFAIPAIGVWLCNPLLSLIDTSAVGILSGTIQQAALNPAVAVTDYSALLMAFLYTGTTNLVAAAFVKDQIAQKHNSTTAPKTTNTLIGVLKLSTFVGMGLSIVLLCSASTLLRLLIGNDSINPEVFHAAMKYVQIRALGMPAAALIGSAQAACLGMQDIKSPLYVLFAAAIVNFLGDVLFVGNTHPWIGGAAGAAWATVFSQYAAATMFIYWLRHKKVSPAPIMKGPNSRNNDSSSLNPSKNVMNLSKSILELTSTKASVANSSRRRRFLNTVRSILFPTSEQSDIDTYKSTVTSTNNSTTPKSVSYSARGFLEGKIRKRDLITFPDQQTLKEFAPYVIPVTTTMIGRLSGYVAMSHVVSSSLGTVSMAAQQVIVSLFYCLCPIADSLSLTAQSFFPSISESPAGPSRSHAMKQTAINFFKAASIFGAITMTAVSCIPLYSGFFTADPSVIKLVNMVVPYLLGFFAVHGFVCGSEGLLLGRKDLGFLGKMYAGFFVVVPYLMLRVKHAALNTVQTSASKINLTAVWKIFVGYQLFRSVAWMLRLTILQRQSKNDDSNIKGPASVSP